MAFKINFEMGLVAPKSSDITAIKDQIEKGLGKSVISIKPQLDKASVDAFKKELQAQLSAQVVPVSIKLVGPTTGATSVSTAVSQLSNPTVSKNLQNLERGLRQVDAEMRKIERIRAGQTINNLSESMEQFADRTGIALKRFLAFTLATGGIVKVASEFKQAFSAAVQFEESLVKIGQVSDRSLKNLDGLRSSILNISRSIGTDSNEIANAALTIAQAGIPLKEVKGALEAIAKAQVSPTFGTAQESAEALIAVMSQFKKEAGNYESVLARINFISAREAVEAKDLITSVQKAGGAFALAGSNLNEFLSIITAVRATTRESADSIATGLRTITSRIADKDTIEFFRRKYQVDIAPGNKVDDTITAIGKIRKRMDELGQLPVKTSIDPLTGNVIEELDKKTVAFSEVLEKLGGQRQQSRLIPLFTEYNKIIQLVSSFDEIDPVSRLKKSETTLAKDVEASQAALQRSVDRTKESFKQLGNELLQNDGTRRLIELFLAASRAIADTTKEVVKFSSVFIPLFAGPVVKGIATIFNPTRLIGAKPNFNLNKYATGGEIFGNTPGDSVPCMLTPGEVVLNKGQQANISRITGMSAKDVFGKIGVPGFSGGGVLGYRGSNYTEYKPPFGPSGFYPGVYYYHGEGAEEGAKSFGKHISTKNFSGANLFMMNRENTASIEAEASKAGFGFNQGSGYPVARYLKSIGYTGIMRGNEIIDFADRFANGGRVKKYASGGNINDYSSGVDQIRSLYGISSSYRDWMRTNRPAKWSPEGKLDIGTETFKDAAIELRSAIQSGNSEDIRNLATRNSVYGVIGDRNVSKIRQFAAAKSGTLLYDDRIHDSDLIGDALGAKRKKLYNNNGRIRLSPYGELVKGYAKGGGIKSDSDVIQHLLKLSQFYGVGLQDIIRRVKTSTPEQLRQGDVQGRAGFAPKTMTLSYIPGAAGKKQIEHEFLHGLDRYFGQIAGQTSYSSEDKNTPFYSIAQKYRDTRIKQLQKLGKSVDYIKNRVTTKELIVAFLLEQSESDRKKYVDLQREYIGNNNFQIGKLPTGKGSPDFKNFEPAEYPQVTGLPNIGYSSPSYVFGTKYNPDVKDKKESDISESQKSIIQKELARRMGNSLSELRNSGIDIYGPFLENDPRKSASDITYEQSQTLPSFSGFNAKGLPEASKYEIDRDLPYIDEKDFTGKIPDVKAPDLIKSVVAKQHSLAGRKLSKTGFRKLSKIDEDLAYSLIGDPSKDEVKKIIRLQETAERRLANQGNYLYNTSHSTTSSAGIDLTGIFGEKLGPNIGLFRRLFSRGKSGLQNLLKANIFNEDGLTDFQVELGKTLKYTDIYGNFKLKRNMGGEIPCYNEGGQTDFEKKYKYIKNLYHSGTYNGTDPLRPFTHFGTIGAANHILNHTYAHQGIELNLLNGMVGYNKAIKMKDSKRAHTPLRIVEDLMEEGFNVPHLDTLIAKIEKEKGKEEAANVLAKALRNRGIDAIEYVNRNEDPGSMSLMTVNPDQFSLIKKFAHGGTVPGTGFGDTVPALLSPGEVVLNKRQQGKLDQLTGSSAALFKAAGVPGFKDGGSPGITSPKPGRSFGDIAGTAATAGIIATSLFPVENFGELGNIIQELLPTVGLLGAGFAGLNSLFGNTRGLKNWRDEFEDSQIKLIEATKKQEQYGESLQNSLNVIRQGKNERKFLGELITDQKKKVQDVKNTGSADDLAREESVLLGLQQKRDAVTLRSKSALNDYRKVSQSDELKTNKQLLKDENDKNTAIKQRIKDGEKLAKIFAAVGAAGLAASSFISGYGRSQINNAQLFDNDQESSGKSKIVAGGAISAGVTGASLAAQTGNPYLIAAAAVGGTVLGAYSGIKEADNLIKEKYSEALKNLTESLRGGAVADTNQIADFSRILNKKYNIGKSSGSFGPISSSEVGGYRLNFNTRQIFGFDAPEKQGVFNTELYNQDAAAYQGAKGFSFRNLRNFFAGRDEQAVDPEEALKDISTGSAGGKYFKNAEIERDTSEFLLQEAGKFTNFQEFSQRYSQQINQLATASNIEAKLIETRFERIITDVTTVKNQQRAAIKALDDQADGIDKFNSSLAASMEKIARSNIDSILGEDYRIIAPSLRKPDYSDPKQVTQFQDDLDFVTGGFGKFGADAGGRFASILREQSRFEEQLRDFKAGNGQTTEDFTEKFFASSNLSTTDKAILKGNVSQFFGDNNFNKDSIRPAADAAKNFAQLLEQAKEPIELMSKATVDAANRLSGYAKKVEQLRMQAEDLRRPFDQISKVIDIRTSSKRITEREALGIRGENERAREVNITGNRNSQELVAEIQRLDKSIMENEKRAPTITNKGLLKDLLVQIEAEKAARERAKNGLDFLAKSTERLTVKQNELQQAEEERLGKRQIFETLGFGTSEDKFSLQRDLEVLKDDRFAGEAQVRNAVQRFRGVNVPARDVGINSDRTLDELANELAAKTINRSGVGQVLGVGGNLGAEIIQTAKQRQLDKEAEALIGVQSDAQGKQASLLEQQAREIFVQSVKEFTSMFEQFAREFRADNVVVQAQKVVLNGENGLKKIEGAIALEGNMNMNININAPGFEEMGEALKKDVMSKINTQVVEILRKNGVPVDRPIS